MVFNFTKICISSLLFLGFITNVHAQNFNLSGKVIDRINQTPLIGANVAMINAQDSTERLYAITNVDGEFKIAGLKKRLYNLSVSYIGYEKTQQNVIISFRNQTLTSSVLLSPKAEVLKDVTIVGQTPPVTLKGDTTEFNATAYKTNPDANVEDLVKKIPGVTVEDGAVKAQGEDVKKVLIDGKPFFGDDPSLALRNLPSEIVDKVQIFDQQSEQSQLTGFNDGETSKTMNIITKSNRREGQFGKFSGAYGDQDRYLVAGNMNKFKGNERITAIASTNNIGQQNFMTQDLLGVMGGNSAFGNRGGGGNHGGNNRGGGGRSGGNMSNVMVGPQSGISTVNSIGLNYSNTFNEKLTASGSYFFNNNNTINDQFSNTENILGIDTSLISMNQSNSHTKNFNNRLNLRIEYEPDSMNRFIFIPSVNFQSNTSNSLNNSSSSNRFLENEYLVNTAAYNSNSETSGFNISGRLTYRHRFKKTGRTISADLNTSFNERVPYSTTLSDQEFYLRDSSSLTNRINTTMNSGYTFGSNIAYTEPVSKTSMVQLNISNSFTENYSYKKVSEPYSDSVFYRVDRLSNKYLNNFLTNRIGLSYLLRGTKFYASAGFELQSSGLNGDQTFPSVSETDKRFTNILPNAMINYRITQQSRLMINYRTSTNPPSITQLQSVPDPSDNNLRITFGNPNLVPQYSHSLSGRLTKVNREKGTNFFVFLMGTVSQNNIGTSVTYDTLRIAYINYVNKGTSYNLRSFANYGFSIKPIKCNLNITGGFNYNKTPGFVNGNENLTNNYSINNGLVFSSNISEKIDFTLSLNGSYNIVKNTITPENDNNYYSQNTNLKFNYIFWKNFTFQNEVQNRLYTGLNSEYNQNITLWNAGLGKKFMKNNAAEFRISVFDILKQNSAVSRTISGNQIIDSKDQTMSRYFLVSFIYTFRNFSFGSAPQNDSNRDRNRERFPGGDGRPSDHGHMD